MAVVFKVQMVGVTKPPLWRRFAVPNDATCRDLHVAIQSVFGFEDMHMWAIHSHKRMGQGWCLTGSSGFSLGWNDLGDTDDKELEKPMAEVGVPGLFYYTYDFGDSWLFSVKIEKVDDTPVSYYRLLGSKGENPEEDMGGIWGYMRRRYEGDDSEEEE